jgi:hypothetical protein
MAPLRPLTLALLAVALLAGCSSAPPRGHVSNRILRDGCTMDILEDAESDAPAAGRKILAQARKMTVDQKVILPGACWDYVNTVWNKAGYPEAKRSSTFKSKRGGPYAQPKDILPGDWCYFINHSYHNIDHSALFVAWSDRGNRQAYMLSYAGEKRAEPARYMLYELSSVYRVIRGKD